MPVVVNAFLECCKLFTTLFQNVTKCFELECSEMLQNCYGGKLMQNLCEFRNVQDKFSESIKNKRRVEHNQPHAWSNYSRQENVTCDELRPETQ